MKVRCPAVDLSPVGIVSRHCLVRDQRDLVLDALLDLLPVQVLEHRCHVVAPVELRDYASERILNALQLLDVGRFGATIRNGDRQIK